MSLGDVGISRFLPASIRYLPGILLSWTLTIRDLLVITLLTVPYSTTPSAQGRETIFNRIVHLEPSLITEVPATPRLEDSLGIAGRKISVGEAELWVAEDGSGPPWS